MEWYSDRMCENAPKFCTLGCFLKSYFQKVLNQSNLSKANIFFMALTALFSSNSSTQSGVTDEEQLITDTC